MHEHLKKKLRVEEDGRRRMKEEFCFCASKAVNKDWRRPGLRHYVLLKETPACLAAPTIFLKAAR
jgi:hypothetical protein